MFVGDVQGFTASKLDKGLCAPPKMRYCIIGVSEDSREYKLEA